MPAASETSLSGTAGRKVLLVGWDAADWKVIDPLLDAGKMPNLARFLERGAAGNIATLQPVLSPMLWTSIATGKRPYKHGVHGFSEPDPATGGIRPITNLSRKTKAVWNILNQNGLSTITIGWWPSNPAEPLSRGVMVSNDFQRAPGSDPAKWPMKPGTVHPKRLEKHLAPLRFHPAELAEDDLLPFLPGLVGMSQEELDEVAADPRIQSLMKIVADCTSVHAAATALMQNEPWDLMCVYYDAIDHFGHAFMKYHPPRRPHIGERDYRIFNHCVEAGYRYHDMMLGTLLQLAGEDATVLLMSDHGFHPDEQRPSSLPREPAGPAAEHRQFGIFAAAGPGIKRDERIYGASLLDVCPTLLHLFGLPVGEDMDGRVLTGIYRDPPAEIPSIPSWDEVPGDDGMHPPDKQISAEDSRAALEQLVALGYIEEPGEDRSKAVEQTVRELDYNLARAYIDGGIYTEAVAILERLYERWPLEHRFAFNLATCHQATNRPADLRRVVDTVRERRLAQAREARKKLETLRLDDEAVRQAEKERLEKMAQPERKKFLKERADLLAEARPNLFTLRYLEAWADTAEGRHGEALSKLDELDTDFGARRKAMMLRGEILMRLRRWKDARAVFEEALALDAAAPAPLGGLARAALAERDFEAAASHARRSIGLLYFQPKMHYILGLARYRNGEWAEAEEAFLQCVRQAPLFSAAWRKLSEIARRVKADPVQAVFFKQQVKESRKRIRELRRKKAEGTGAAVSPAESQNPGDAPEPEMPALRPPADPPDPGDPADTITLVSGLPRSGTSLMMQILEAAGIPPHTDGRRQADESNRKGYYEHGKTGALLAPGDKSWLAEARGRALKVVAPLLAALPLQIQIRPAKSDPPRKLRYRLLFMERPMDEVLDSQRAMLGRLGKKTPERGDPAKAYREQVRRAKTWALRHEIPALSVDFHALVHRPDSVLPEIAAFLGAENMLPAMRACIDPSLHRSRRSARAEEQASDP